MIHLTNRQKEIAVLIAKGLSNEDIAKELNITLGTVKNHVSSVYSGLELDIAPENVRRIRVLIYVLLGGMVNWYDWAEEVECFQLQPKGGRRKMTRTERT